MSVLARMVAAWMLLFLAGGAMAEEMFDPRSYQARLAGAPTQIFVLGTPHLSGTAEDWDPAALEPLLERLARFQPDVITIEALSGQAVSALWRYRPVYGETATDYGGRIMIMAASASVGTGLDMPEAEAEARRLLRAWPEAPAPAQRRRLAALFAAAGDPHSALVQWWRLDPAERRAGDGVNSALAAQLDEYEARRNENHLIGSRLAARLGLERVHPIDAQDDDVFTPEQSAAFGTQIFEPTAARFRADPRVRDLIEAVNRLGSGEQALDSYRRVNAPAATSAGAELEWQAMVEQPTAGDLGRIRLAGWEVRNLRMVANIRQAASGAPGGRVLVIVGAGHKVWLEAYLRMMADVRVVDSADILR
jgi:hypothetical protein